jgi:hypothetical protein
LLITLFIIEIFSKLFQQIKTGKDRVANPCPIANQTLNGASQGTFNQGYSAGLKKVLRQPKTPEIFDFAVFGVYLHRIPA